MRKVKINDNQGQSVEVDIDEFKKHLDEYHSSGSSVHDEDGHYFTVDQNTMPPAQLCMELFYQNIYLLNLVYLLKGSLHYEK